MDTNKIEALIQKYENGTITKEEENVLRIYFSSSNVATNLEQYKPIFDNFVSLKTDSLEKDIPVNSRKLMYQWVVVGAIILVILGFGIFNFSKQEVLADSQDLGTFDDPEVAFIETQKALNSLSAHINTGYESLRYFEEYDNSKNLIFK